MAKILICDDDPIYCAMVAEFFRGAGHEAKVASTIAEFNDFAQTERFDLIVLDMQVPGGGPSAKNVRVAGVPIIVSSGMPVEQQKKWFADHERMRFVSKPPDLKLLEACAKELLSGAL